MQVLRKLENAFMTFRFVAALALIMLACAGCIDMDEAMPHYLIN